MLERKCKIFTHGPCLLKIHAVPQIALLKIGVDVHLLYLIKLESGVLNITLKTTLGVLRTIPALILANKWRCYRTSGG